MNWVSVLNESSIVEEEESQIPIGELATVKENQESYLELPVGSKDTTNTDSSCSPEDSPALSWPQQVNISDLLLEFQDVFS